MSDSGELLQSIRYSPRLISRFMTGLTRLCCSGVFRKDFLAHIARNRGQPFSIELIWMIECKLRELFRIQLLLMLSLCTRDCRIRPQGVERMSSASSWQPQFPLDLETASAAAFQVLLASSANGRLQSPVRRFNSPTAGTTSRRRSPNNCCGITGPIASSPSRRCSNTPALWRMLLQGLRERQILLPSDNFESVRALADPNGARPSLMMPSGNECGHFWRLLAPENGKSALIITSRTP